MKNLTFLFLIVIGLYFTSCKPDATKTIEPTTNDGREIYVGTWTCNETSQISGNTSYPISISKSTTSSSEILINRFYDIPSQEVRATVSGNTITIPFQQLGTIGYVKGSGIFSLNSGNSALSMAYTTTVSVNTDTCTASCAK